MTYTEQLFSLKGKVAIVTGGARGNGRAISEALSLSGAIVVIIDILEEEAQSLSGVLNCDYYICDITSNEQLEEMVKYVIDQHNKIDILVNNAGISLGQKFEDYSDEKWDSTYRVNLKAPFKLSQLVARQMIRQKSGSIINISSLNADLAFPENPAYVACKGGLKQLTKAIAYDLGKYGIRANNITPGYMLTSMTMNSWLNPVKRRQRADRSLLGRWGKPSDLAGAAVFLASDASSFITGLDLFVDGGWSTKGI
jgi:NAD(P)-dependent dehydrogenase (short-subunit alcohol dehydrogenase family)